MVTLFSWAHLSDLQFGASSAEKWVHNLVLSCLREDVAAHRAAEGPLDAIFVTGGVAAEAGGSDGKRPYELARIWLSELARAAGVGPDRVFLVPGAEDVRTPAGHRRARSVARLVARLREGAERLDDAIADEDDFELLMCRLDRYLDFAEGFAPACLEERGVRRRLSWSHRLTGRQGLAVRLVGLTTALLCSGEDDRGKLQLGAGQLGETLGTVKDGELCVVLSHHPLQEGWLADQKEAEGWISTRAHIHLTGHASEAESVMAQRGGARGLVRVCAGAAHDRIAQGHRYNVGAVALTGSGAPELRVWHRRWSNKNMAFVPDTDAVPKGQWFASHPLDAKIALGPDSKPTEDLREDFRSRSDVLERRIQDVLSAATPSASREALVLLEKELNRYVASVDDDLKRARAAHTPSAREAEAALRAEVRGIRQRAQRTLSRVKLGLMLDEGAPVEKEVFSCSGVLVALGTKEDAALLRQAESRWAFDFLPVHLRALLERTGAKDGAG